MARILLVEDDPRIANPLQRELQAERHAVDLAEDGLQAWDYLQTSAYELAIIDVLLPRLSGIDLCQRMRDARDDTRVLLLTALDQASDKVRGLDAGADDYLVKPFSLDELHARIRALLRRPPAVPPTLRWGSLELHPAAKEARVHDAPLALTPKEYQLLDLFLRSPGRTLEVEEILQRLWGWEAPSRGSVKVHLRSLREKLREAGVSNPVETLYGRGYRLAHEP